MVVADAEFLFTESRFFQLAARLRSQLDCEVAAVTNEEYVQKSAMEQGVSCTLLNMNPPHIDQAQRTTIANEMIAQLRDFNIPGSDLPLWKIIALDDFIGSLGLSSGINPEQVDIFERALPDCDVVILPFLVIDNNTIGSCNILVWAMTQAKRRGIPTIGVEVSPLGNKT